MDNFGFCGLLINGKPLDQYGAAALLDYSVGETAITNETFQGINRSSWHLLKSFFGTRKVTLTIVFTGDRVRTTGFVFHLRQFFLQNFVFRCQRLIFKHVAVELFGLVTQTADAVAQRRHNALHNGTRNVYVCQTADHRQSYRKQDRNDQNRAHLAAEIMLHR